MTGVGKPWMMCHEASSYSQSGEDPMRDIAAVTDDGRNVKHQVQPVAHYSRHVPSCHEAGEMPRRSPEAATRLRMLRLIGLVIVIHGAESFDLKSQESEDSVTFVSLNYIAQSINSI